MSVTLRTPLGGSQITVDAWVKAPKEPSRAARRATGLGLDAKGWSYCEEVGRYKDPIKLKDPTIRLSDYPRILSRGPIDGHQYHSCKRVLAIFGNPGDPNGSNGMCRNVFKF